MKLYLASHNPDGVPLNFSALVGSNRRVAVIANARDGTTEKQRGEALVREIDQLSAIGLVCEELDLRRYFDRTKSLDDEIQRFGVIWAMSGNAFVLRRAMRYSGLDVILAALLRETEIVYGGCSAGAVVAGPTLHGIDLVDNPYEVPSKYKTPVIWTGLGLVPYRIAPHFRSRNSQTFAIERVVDYFAMHKVEYRTLSDGQAIVVDGDVEHLRDLRAPELISLASHHPMEWSMAQMAPDTGIDRR